MTSWRAGAEIIFQVDLFQVSYIYILPEFTYLCAGLMLHDQPGYCLDYGRVPFALACPFGNYLGLL